MPNSHVYVRRACQYYVGFFLYADDGTAVACRMTVARSKLYEFLSSSK